MAPLEQKRQDFIRERGEANLPTVMGADQLVRGATGYTQARGKASIDVDWERFNGILDKFPEVASTALKVRKVVILGGGTSGQAAADKAIEAGAKIVITDIDPEKIDFLKNKYAGMDVEVLHGIRDEALIEDHIADLETAALVGAVLVPGAEAPDAISRDTLERGVYRRLGAMKKATDNIPDDDDARRYYYTHQLGVFDIAIDQGGCIPEVVGVGVQADSEPAYHDHPFHPGGFPGVVRYTVANMPGRPGVISEYASNTLQEATLPVAKQIIRAGTMARAVQDNPLLLSSVNAVSGQLTVAAMQDEAAEWGLDIKDPSQELARLGESQKDEFILFVPKEIKQQEGRVGLLPANAAELLKWSREHGINLRIMVESGAGLLSNGPDQAYIEAARAVGAEDGIQIIDDADAGWAAADMVMKVKEPLSNENGNEFERMRDGQIVFTYFHLASGRELTEGVLGSRATAVAYETYRDADGELPMLEPMSIVAGWEAILDAAAVAEGVVKVVHEAEK